MPRETIVVDLSESYPSYEAGAVILAALAYPEDKTRREHFFYVLCRQAVIINAQSITDWAVELQPIRPKILLQDEKLADQTMRAGVKLLEHRMVATRQVMPHLKAIAVKRRPGALSVQGLPPTVGNMAIIMARDLKLKDGSAATMKSDVWGPSKPVIHMAAAIATVGQQISESAVFPMLMLLYLPQLVPGLCERSEHYRSMLPEIQQFTIRDEDTIRFVAN